MTQKTEVKILAETTSFTPDAAQSFSNWTATKSIKQWAEADVKRSKMCKKTDLLARAN